MRRPVSFLRPLFSVLSQFLTPSVVSSSSHCLLTPFLSSFLSPSCRRSFSFFSLFLILSSHGPSHSQFLTPRSCAARTPSRIKTLTLCYSFSQRRKGVRNRDARRKMKMSKVRNNHGRERERVRPAIVIQSFRYVGQISVSGRISPLIKRPILHFAPPRHPGWRSLSVITNK